MATVICNPTDEDFKLQYAGIDKVLKGVCEEFPKGQAIKVPTPEGNHYMNAMGPRGLVELDYDDKGTPKEAAKLEAGRQRNYDWRKKQVDKYNFDNQRRFNEGMPYLTPPPHIVQMANDLGIELFQPYAAPNQAAVERREDQKKIESLEKANAALMTQMQEILAAMQQQGKSPKTEEDRVKEGYREQYAGLGKAKLKAWVEENLPSLRDWPDDMKAELKEKYGKLYNDELEI